MTVGINEYLQLRPISEVLARVCSVWELVSTMYAVLLMCMMESDPVMRCSVTFNARKLTFRLQCDADIS